VPECAVIFSSKKSLKTAYSLAKYPDSYRDFQGFLDGKRTSSLAQFIPASSLKGGAKIKSVSMI